MIDYSEYLEGYRDAQAYDVEDGDYDADYPLTAQLARELGGPLLDLACGTGTMAIRMARLGYEVTGVDIMPEMIAWASQKAQTQGVSIDWVVADARTFHLLKQFPFIYMLGNALLFYNGFQIRSCYGSWQQEPLTATSRYMIYVCQRR